MKKARITITQANSIMTFVRKLSKKLVNPSRSDAWSSRGHAASKPAPASRPGFRRSSAETLPPPAVSPAMAKERKMISEREEKLLMMKAKAPTKRIFFRNRQITSCTPHKIGREKVGTSGNNAQTASSFLHETKKT